MPLIFAVQILASGSFDDTIRIYEDDPDDDWFCSTVLGDSHSHSPTGHTATVWDLSWSPCGTYLASVSADLSIRIWARTQPGGGKWECVHVIEDAHGRCIYGVSWRAARQGDRAGSVGYIATVGEDGAIRVWNIMVGQYCPSDTGAHLLLIETSRGC